MILKNGTMNEIILKLQNKRVYCFGAGKAVEELQKRYETFSEIVMPEGFIDNNTKLQGDTIKFGKNHIPIISVDKFLQVADKDTVVLFTLFHWESALSQLDELEELKSMECYSYHMIITEEEDEKIYMHHLPIDSIDNEKAHIIPKIIHYCWFGGGKMPEEFESYINSWRKYCPDYEIIEWNEKNYDVYKNEYIRQAYEDKKWAYVSDYARLDVVYQYGGIYLDTDVELVKSLDELLGEVAFCGIENMKNVNFGLGFGSIKGNSVIRDIMELYEKIQWDGGKVPCTYYQTEVLKKYGFVENNGFQRLKYITVLPAECLCAKSILTRKIRITPRTYAIHHFAATWYDFSEWEKKRLEFWERLNYEDE